MQARVRHCQLKRNARVGTFETEEIHSNVQPQREQTTKLLANLEMEAESALVPIGTGLSAIPKKLMKCPLRRERAIPCPNHWRGRL